jgi:hypothetical protein
VSRRVRSTLRRIGPLRSAVESARLRRRRARFTADLRLLSDTMARSPLHGRWWVFGGLLLGWAREGRLLDHDLHDADFGYRQADHERFLACVPMLDEAGFAPRHRYVGNSGRTTEYRFARGGGQFEFFEMRPSERGLRYSLYAESTRVEELTELTVEVGDQPLVPFEFLGRTWMKSADHEKDLEVTYGEWRIPDLTFSFVDQPNIVDRQAWRHPGKEWDGSTPA